MLESLRIANFEGVVEADLKLGPGMTFLYGRNGAGKTSTFEALLYCLTGQSVRGETLPEAIRQGAKQLDVELTLAGGRSLMRWRTPRGGEQYLDGVQVKQAEFDAAATQLLGCDLRAAALALRSGALLELAPAELQSFLLQISGRQIGQEAIAAAIHPPVAAALGRLRYAVPKSIPELAVVAAKAIEERKEAKRTEKVVSAQLEGLVWDRALEADVRATTTAAIEDELSRLQGQRDTAIATAARRSGRSEELCRRLEQLQAVPEAAEVDLASAQRAWQEAAADLERAKSAGLHLKQTVEKATAEAAGHQQLPADAEQLPALLEQLQKKHAAGRDWLAGQRRRVSDLGNVISALRGAAGGHCPTCRQSVAPEHLSALQRLYDDERGKFGEVEQGVKEAQDEIADLERRIAECDSIRRRQEVAATLPGLQARLEEARAEFRSCDERAGIQSELLQAAQQQANARQAWRSAQQEIASIKNELAAVPADGPALDLAAVEARIATLTRLLACARVMEQRDSLREDLRDALETIEDADLVAQAFGPTGIRLQLVRDACGPFLSAANAALAELAQMSVDLDITDGDMAFVVARSGARLAPRELSDGERVRLLVAMQIAIASLTKAPVIAIDRVELVDAAGRNDLWRLMSTATRTQFLMLTTATPPQSVPPGIQAYVLEDGRARAVPTLVAA